MPTGAERLLAAARDEWADPLVAARQAATGMLEMLDSGWYGKSLRAVEELRQRRADSPLLLAATEAALDPDPARARRALSTLRDKLEDRTWADEIGRRVAFHHRLGVVSLGESTLEVLEAAGAAGGTAAELFTDRRAIARGLEYLGLLVVVAPPEEADVVLIPAAAVYGSRIWTTSRAADIALRAGIRGTDLTIVAHPLVRLSPLNRAVFRPAAILTDVKL